MTKQIIKLRPMTERPKKTMGDIMIFRDCNPSPSFGRIFALPISTQGWELISSEVLYNKGWLYADDLQFEVEKMNWKIIEILTELQKAGIKKPSIIRYQDPEKMGKMSLEIVIAWIQKGMDLNLYLIEDDKYILDDDIASETLLQKVSLSSAIQKLQELLTDKVVGGNE